MPDPIGRKVALEAHEITSQDPGIVGICGGLALRIRLSGHGLVLLDGLIPGPARRCDRQAGPSGTGKAYT
jgi:hypothetical protein